ncbi:S26 family signal peptidase [Bradyrhizobium stylosanthis]|uniref:Conjugation peptidase TraF n=1 Tax=Bradyrhizobium stylosanthis TaxID=1803665 RepID=A0A560E330_9BRAD|nr:S26 family signal peptidase [Bradyrhizobium stylosanthis]TWB03673.1 conjugation peptidase TraF [Bradyrhizobium stylosanthis]
MLIDRNRPWRQLAALSAMSAGTIAALVSFAPQEPVVIYNASRSAPLGFYYVEPRVPARGELAVYKPPPTIELLILAHEILPAPVPLLKQVVAGAGDEVCRAKDPIGSISINGKVTAEVSEKDREGRPLPSWEGCFRLVEGEFFLMQPHPSSFDSRYFGPVMRCDILGVAKSIWTWAPEG